MFKPYRIALIVLLFHAGFLQAQPASLIVTDAWARRTPGSEVAAVYFKVQNTDSVIKTITGAGSTLAVHTTIHRTTVVSGQSQMRDVPEVILKPGQIVNFAPGGLHLMLMGLKKATKTGEQLPIELQLKNGVKVSFSATIKPLNLSE
jgi:periplasmic copper chaperone A